MTISTTIKIGNSCTLVTARTTNRRYAYIDVCEQLDIRIKVTLNDPN